MADARVSHRCDGLGAESPQNVGPGQGDSRVEFESIRIKVYQSYILWHPRSPPPGERVAGRTVGQTLRLIDLIEFLVNSIDTEPGARRDGSQTQPLTPTTRFRRSVPAVVVDAQMWVAY